MRPNVLFVFSDQHRRFAMSLWQREVYRRELLGAGDPVETPRLDALAEEGILVSGAYSSYPVCSPFRAMLFSGRYPSGNGVWQNCAPGRSDALRADIPTLTDALAAGGYSVGYVGKWHLEEPKPEYDENGGYIGDRPDYSGPRCFPDGSPESNTACWDTLIPPDRQRGIEFLYAYNTYDVFRRDPDAPAVRSPHYWDRDLVRHQPPPDVWTPDHETDVAIRFLRNERGERDGEKPFALFVGYNPPHSPYRSREDTDRAAYDRLASVGLPPRENVEKDDETFRENTRVYYAHVGGIDRCIGRLLDALDEIGARENTVVVFTSDHGEMLGSHGLMAKNVPYEEATAIPFVIRYPERLSPRTDDLFLTGVDIMPTLLGLVGLPIPQGVQGRDYSGLLERGEGSRPDSAFFVQPKRKGVRTRRYLFTLSYGDEEHYAAPTLFDLQSDPYEMLPLPLGAIPEEDLLFLRRELGAWLAASDDPWYTRRLYADMILYPESR